MKLILFLTVFQYGSEYFLLMKCGLDLMYIFWLILLIGGLNVEGESDSWDFGVGMLLLTVIFVVKQDNFDIIFCCFSN